MNRDSSSAAQCGPVRTLVCLLFASLLPFGPSAAYAADVDLKRLFEAAPPAPDTLRNLQALGHVRSQAAALDELNAKAAASPGAASQGARTSPNVRIAASAACAGQPEGSSCDDGVACTASSTCQAGACVSESPNCRDFADA